VLAPAATAVAVVMAFVFVLSLVLRCSVLRVQCILGFMVGFVAMLTVMPTVAVLRFATARPQCEDRHENQPDAQADHENREHVIRAAGHFGQHIQFARRQELGHQR
jgi:hypothetical protein